MSELSDGCVSPYGEMVNAADLKSSTLRFVGSSPTGGTKPYPKKFPVGKNGENNE